MANITVPSQRKLYKAYKEARLNELNNLDALLNTGSYSRRPYEDMLQDAKNDILNFISVFEDAVRKEAEEDLMKI